MDAISGILEWSAAGRPLAGQDVSGDRHTVISFEEGTLAAVIDGLGHGEEAAEAAEIAADTIGRYAGLSVAAVMERCHKAMRRSRGAAITLACFHSRRQIIEWLGVGNVDALLFRADRTAMPARESLLLQGGVVGYRLPTLRSRSLPVLGGDLLVLASDGIGREYGNSLSLDRDPGALAAAILAAHAKPNDDALVLVARYKGSG